MVECFPPEENCIACITCTVEFLYKAICTPKLQRLVYCCCYLQLHVVSRKQKEFPSQSIYLWDANKDCKITRLNWKAKKKKHMYKRICLKPTVLSSLFSLLFLSSLSWKFWPQLDREYASFASLFFLMYDLILMQGKIKIL